MFQLQKNIHISSKCPDTDMNDKKKKREKIYQKFRDNKEKGKKSCYVAAER